MPNSHRTVSPEVTRVEHIDCDLRFALFEKGSPGISVVAGLDDVTVRRPIAGREGGSLRAVLISRLSLLCPNAVSEISSSALALRVRHSPHFCSRATDSGEPAPLAAAAPRERRVVTSFLLPRHSPAHIYRRRVQTKDRLFELAPPTAAAFV